MSKSKGGDFLAKVRRVAKKEGQYDLEAYLFVFQALEFTLKRVGERRHISGPELLEGIKDFALLNFGAMGKAVFSQWGVRESVDFGRIVFSLVQAELMSKTENDAISDFTEGFDFDETFCRKYVPAKLPDEQNA